MEFVKLSNNIRHNYHDNRSLFASLNNLKEQVNNTVYEQIINRTDVMVRYHKLLEIVENKIKNENISSFDAEYRLAYMTTLDDEFPNDIILVNNLYKRQFPFDDEYLNIIYRNFNDKK